MGRARRQLAGGLALAAGLGLGMPGAWGQGAGVVVLPTERQEAIPIEADKGVELAPGDAVPGGCVVERLRQLVECLLDARSGACPEILKSCGFTEHTRLEETLGLLVGAYATWSPVVTFATQRVEAGLATYDLRFENASEKDLFAAKVDRTATGQAPEFRQIDTIDSITARAADGVEAESKLQDETWLKVAQLLEEQAVERHPCLQEVRINSVNAVDLRGKVVAEAPKLSLFASAIVPAPGLDGLMQLDLVVCEDLSYEATRTFFVSVNGDQRLERIKDDTIEGVLKTQELANRLAGLVEPAAFRALAGDYAKPDRPFQALADATRLVRELANAAARAAEAEFVTDTMLRPELWSRFTPTQLEQLFPGGVKAFGPAMKVELLHAALRADQPPVVPQYAALRLNAEAFGNTWSPELWQQAKTLAGAVNTDKRNVTLGQLRCQLKRLGGDYAQRLADFNNSGSDDFLPRKFLESLAQICLRDKPHGDGHGNKGKGDHKGDGDGQERGHGGQEHADRGWGNGPDERSGPEVGHSSEVNEEGVPQAPGRRGK